MTRPRVLLADDHMLVLEGLTKLMERDFEVVGAVNSGTEAVRKAIAHQPDVVLLDITMPDMSGFEAAKEIKKYVPNAKLIAVTMHRSVAYQRESMKAGISGFVLKQSAASELAEAVQKVMQGESYVTPLLSDPGSGASGSNQRPLTTRQREVLKLIAQGCIAKEIAASLNISVRTAEFHKIGIMQKLGLRTTAQLTRYALENDILH